MGSKPSPLQTFTQATVSLPAPLHGNYFDFYADEEESEEEEEEEAMGAGAAAEELEREQTFNWPPVHPCTHALQTPMHLSPLPLDEVRPFHASLLCVHYQTG